MKGAGHVGQHLDVEQDELWILNPDAALDDSSRLQLVVSPAGSEHIGAATWSHDDTQLIVWKETGKISQNGIYARDIATGDETRLAGQRDVGVAWWLDVRR